MLRFLADSRLARNPNLYFEIGSSSDFPSYALNFLAADNTDETFVDPYMQIHTVR